jgi:hypothetical protein
LLRSCGAPIDSTAREHDLALRACECAGCSTSTFTRIGRTLRPFHGHSAVLVVEIGQFCSSSVRVDGCSVRIMKTLMGSRVRGF